MTKTVRNYSSLENDFRFRSNFHGNSTKAFYIFYHHKITSLTNTAIPLVSAPLHMTGNPFIRKILIVNILNARNKHLRLAFKWYNPQAYILTRKEEQSCPLRRTWLGGKKWALFVTSVPVDLISSVLPGETYSDCKSKYCKIYVFVEVIVSSNFLLVIDINAKRDYLTDSSVLTRGNVCFLIQVFLFAR